MTGARKGKAKPSAADILIENMEVIYWGMMAMWSEAMLRQALARRTEYG